MKETIIKSLSDWIEAEKQNIIRDLTYIVSVKSVSEPDSVVKPFGEGVKEALVEVLKLGENAGFKVRNHENFVGEIRWEKTGKAENTIGIWAHLDVVPEGDGWHTPPYEVCEIDGWLIGRGVSDNKSAAIGVLYILKGLKELNYQPNHDIVLYLGTNEEIGMEDISYFLENEEAPLLSIVPDAGFPGMSGEFGRIEFELISDIPLSDIFLDVSSGSAVNIIPDTATAVLRKTEETEKLLHLSFTESRVKIEEKNDTIVLTAQGVASHAAMPESGVNAIHLLMEALKQLPGISATDKKIFGFLENETKDVYGTKLELNRSDEISGHTVSSGTVLRLEDGIIHLTHDCRFCVTDNAERMIRSIRMVSYENDFSVKIHSKKSPSYVSQDSDAIRILKQSYTEYTGVENVEFPIGKGGTYAGKLPNAIATGICLRKDWKLPDWMEKGHGSVHQPDEALPLEEYFEGIKLLSSMIVSLDSNLQ